MKKKKILGRTSGFGAYKKLENGRYVGGYIVLIVVALAISVLLIVGLVKYRPEQAPVKIAVFPEEPAGSGVADLIENKGKELLVQAGVGAVNLAAGESKTGAIINLDKAIESNPTTAEEYLQRGAAYLMKGKLELGTQDIEKAAALKPEYKNLAIKSRALTNLFKSSKFSVTEEQIKQVMSKMTPEDIKRFTKETMNPSPAEEE